MPIIKSAKKKMRQDKKRRSQNATYKEAYKSAVKKVKKAKSTKGGHVGESLKVAYSKIDKATKKGLMHKNKAAHLKSQVAKLVNTRKK